MFCLKQFIFFLIIWKCSLSLEFLTEKPTYIQTCELSDPNLDNCMKDQVQKLFTQISKGIPGLTNFPSIDPYFAKRLRIGQQNENLVFRATFTNITITGLRNTEVESCKVRNNGSKWEFRFRLPKLRSTTMYEIDGKILSLQLKAKGSMWVESINVHLTVNRDQQFYTNENYAFINFTKISVDVTNVDQIKVNMDNLFGGNKELEKSTNEFFNENWRDFYDAFKPLIIETIKKYIPDITKKVYQYIPAKFFLSDVNNYIQKA